MNQLKISLSDLLEVLPLAWCSETRSENGTDCYAKDEPNCHPSRGQCVVSSLLIRKHFDGNLMRCTVRTQKNAVAPHYFNEINGMWIDSTRAQFNDNLAGYEDIERDPSTHLYIRHDTWRRVRLLEQRALDIINAPYNFGW